MHATVFLHFYATAFLISLQQLVGRHCYREDAIFIAGYQNLYVRRMRMCRVYMYTCTPVCLRAMRWHHRIQCTSLEPASYKITYAHRRRASPSGGKQFPYFPLRKLAQGAASRSKLQFWKCCFQLICSGRFPLDICKKNMEATKEPIFIPLLYTYDDR